MISFFSTQLVIIILLDVKSLQTVLAKGALVSGEMVTCARLRDLSVEIGLEPRVENKRFLFLFHSQNSL